MSDDIQIDEYRSVIGRTITLTQYVDEANLIRFDAAIGTDAPSPLAHWAFFHDVVDDQRLGADGHPLRGDFLPAIEILPRRMFAASVLTFHAPLVVRDKATLTKRILDIRYKHGSSGDMVFVEVEHRVTQANEACVTEQQTLVYLPPAGAAVPEPPAITPGHANQAQNEPWTPGAVNLFRFSAATFNGHRIHYDRRFATEVEGHADLVVHGPFIAARLASIAARRGTLATFAFRASLPCYVDRHIRLVEIAPGSLQAIRNDDRIAMTAKATYR